MIITLGRHSERIAPVEFRDVAAMHARENGCPSGDVVWRAWPYNCWQVRLELPGDDPRRRTRSIEYETVELQEWVHPDPDNAGYPDNPRQLDKLPRDRLGRKKPAYVSMELEDLGIEGLKFILQKGSLGGRGEFKSMGDAMKARNDAHQRIRAKNRAAQKQLAVDYAKAARRQICEIPYLGVLEDVK